MSGWIGVDLDGTLAKWKSGDSINQIGEPIPKMVERVKKWLSDGREVRIMTARVSDGHESNTQQRDLVHAWCKNHLGRLLPVTNVKDYHMWVLYDDRAVSVIKNSGIVSGHEPTELIV